MDVLTIILIVLLVGLTIWLVGVPLWQMSASTPIDEASERPGQSLEELEAQYQASLAAIKDLNFDHEMGKVLTEDYQRLLTKSKLEAARIRQEMDRLSDAELVEQEQALDTEIETQVAQLRQNPNVDEALMADVEAEIEALQALCPHQPPPANFVCPNCGTTLRADDKFCGSCGQAVSHPMAEIEILNTTDHCPDCEYHYQPDDAFCAQCGRPLDEAAIETYERAKI